MKKLKKIGFFHRKYKRGLKRHLEALIQPRPNRNKDKILAYLESGHGLYVVPGVIHDPLDPSEPIIWGPDVATDGIWAWTMDVPYYVKRYNLKLPERFLRHMESVNWQVPAIKNFRKLKL